MLGIDPVTESAAVHLWTAAGSAALIAAFCVLAFSLPRTAVGAAARAGAVVLGAALGAAMIWALAGIGVPSDEHRFLEDRAQELVARAIAPGSPLACLDGLAGESIETACERELFASPAAAAAAITFTAARLALLADLTAYRERSDAAIDAVLLPLRRSIEADRFGFVAHVLATRDGCTSENCKPLALLQHAGRVRANLSEATLQRYLDRHQPLWSKSPDLPVAEATPSQPTTTQSGGQGGPHKVSVNIDFPSSASIPAVSIMNPEPKGPILPGVAAAAAANPNPPLAASSPPRRSRKQAASPPSKTVSGATPAVEPIWPEPLPAAPPRTAAAPPAPPEASAGTLRSQ